jgi:2,3-diketo-5-methylthio-1-phosphopentane phosphatase
VVTSFEVLCDFDGTVTREDTVDVLLERLADPEWRVVEERWVRGEIDSRECMASQIALLRGGWPAIREVLEDVQVDATFASFARWCRRRGIRLRIASGGIDRVIHHLLAREGITVDEVWAPQLLELDGGRRLALQFPTTSGRSRCGSGFCKCVLFERSMPRPVRVLIGDGRSDFCCAHWADRVFARAQLTAHCRARSIRFSAFEDFTRVRRVLQSWTQRPALADEPVATFALQDA